MEQSGAERHPVATSYTPNTGMGIPAAGDRTWNVPLSYDLALLDAMNAIGSGGVQTTEVPSTTLNVKIAAATYKRQDGSISTYAGIASKAMTASSTNYLYLDLTNSGALVVNTTGFPATAHVRLAVVVAGSSSITSIADARVAYTVLGSFADGVDLTFGTVTGTQIGTAANQKLAFFGNTPVVQQTLGVKTAGAAYTTNEQTMLQELWNLVRTMGLGS